MKAMGPSRSGLLWVAAFPVLGVLLPKGPSPAVSRPSIAVSALAEPKCKKFWDGEASKPDKWVDKTNTKVVPKDGPNATGAKNLARTIFPRTAPGLE
jgi:hypothetical protein